MAVFKNQYVPAIILGDTSLQVTVNSPSAPREWSGLQSTRAHSYVVTIRTNRMHYILSIYLLAFGRILPTASQHKRMTYTNCCIYGVVPPDDEQ